MRAQVIFPFIFLSACGGAVPSERLYEEASPDPLCARVPDPAPPDYGYPLDDTLRLNHIQVRGTHNSYHVEPPNAVVAEHRYTHVPLDEGLERLGLRQFELDIHWDEEEGAFTVFHLPVIDEVSTCRLFTECLQRIKEWSDTNPGHHPIFIWVEPKDDLDAAKISDYDALDKEIRSVFPEEKLFTPDELQGEHPSLREAIAAEGWPTLGALRDQVIFALLDTKQHHEGYTRQKTSLRCRAMFVNVDDFDSPFAAIVKINNPRESERIADALSRGLIVGSNVDNAGETDEENAARLAAALENGVHLLSSDLPELVEGRSYQLELPGGTPSRCNPVTAPPECQSNFVEDLAFVQGN